jgi:dUTP pyrophosphatase
MIVKSHYVLKLKVPDELRALYTEAANKHNEAIDCNRYFDAGFDLFCLTEEKVYGRGSEKLDQGVKGSMEFFTQYDNAAAAYGVPCGYFMYPRSSTGSKTPLRLANSIGVIDSGYRSNYIAVFDNCREESFKVERLQRLVQICPPNLTYPMRVLIVDDFGDAAETLRGAGGFGSTGN